MSHHDYEQSKYISMQDWPFYAIIMAAMRQADTNNLELLRFGWPNTYNELQERYNAPGGLIGDEQ